MWFNFDNLSAGGVCAVESSIDAWIMIGALERRFGGGKDFCVGDREIPQTPGSMANTGIIKHLKILYH